MRTNNDLPKVSVIIPCFNQGKYVQESVQSVLKQTFTDFEIIIVDDGSTDQVTRQVLNNLNYPKIKIIHQANGGVSVARNRAIRNAIGEFILPLDADDKLSPTFIEKACAVLEAHPNIGVVYSDVEYFGDRSGPFKLGKFSIERMLVCNCIPISSMFRKSDWEKAGGFDEEMKYLEDYAFWISLLELGLEVYKIPEPLFLYRKHIASATKTTYKEDKTNKIINSMAHIMRKHPKIYLDNAETIMRLLYFSNKKKVSEIHILLYKIKLSFYDFLIKMHFPWKRELINLKILTLRNRIAQKNYNK